MAPVDPRIDAVPDGHGHLPAVLRTKPVEQYTLLGELLVVVGRAPAHQLPFVPRGKSYVFEDVRLPLPRAAGDDVMGRCAVRSWHVHGRPVLGLQPGVEVPRGLLRLARVAV